MSYFSSSNNKFNCLLDSLSGSLIACNAFAMCSDVMPSLIFIGITGYVSALLLFSVVSMWLILYLYGASGDNDKPSFEQDYYINKLTEPVTDDDRIMIKSWVMFNDFRVKLFKYFRQNPKEDRSDYIKNKIKVRLIPKYFKEAKNTEKGIAVAWIDEFYAKFTNKKTDPGKGFASRFLLNEGEINKLIGSNKNEKLISIFAAREGSLISATYMVIIFSTFGAANIIINALTMFGSAFGVMKVISTFFSIVISSFALKLMSIVFLLAGAWSSYKLTRPMIIEFGRKLEDCIYDLKCSMKQSSRYTLLVAFMAFFMAFFTAAASATFAVYNTPIIAMLPPSALGLSFLVRRITFAIVLVSSFSLYFISVSTKLGSWVGRAELWFNIKAVDYKNIFIVLAFIGLSVVADVVCLPIAYHGCIEIVTLFGLGYMNYGKKGILTLVSSLASFAFCSTSYHQIQLCALFTPGLIYNVFIAIGIIFQFFTVAITFYFGSSKLLKSIAADGESMSEAVSTTAKEAVNTAAESVIVNAIKKATAATKIQSVVRDFAGRKAEAKLEAEAKQKQEAATKIQSVVRDFVGRQAALEQKQASAKLETVSNAARAVAVDLIKGVMASYSPTSITYTNTPDPASSASLTMSTLDDVNTGSLNRNSHFAPIDDVNTAVNTGSHQSYDYSLTHPNSNKSISVVSRCSQLLPSEASSESSGRNDSLYPLNVLSSRALLSPRNFNLLNCSDQSGRATPPTKSASMLELGAIFVCSDSPCSSNASSPRSPVSPLICHSTGRDSPIFVKS